MQRSYFIKTLLSLPFVGRALAHRLQSGKGEPAYLLNKFYVAGFQYYDGPSLIGEIQPAEALQLVVQPGNQHDAFAVAIYRGDVMIGYVPRTDNKHLSRLLQQNISLMCKVVAANPDNETWEMLKVHVYL